MRKNTRKILSVILSMAIILSCLSFSMLTAFAAEIDVETGAGSSTVQYTAEPGWIATIPAYIHASDPGEESEFNNKVTIQNVLLGDMQKLVATIDYDGVLAEENGIELKYSLYDGDGKIDPGKRFAEIPAGDPDAVTEYTFGAALDEKPKYAGNYLGTVTFNLSVEDKVYTAEEIEADDHLIPIGKTVDEWVVAKYSDDYSSITVFKNGKDSDGLMKDWSTNDEAESFSDMYSSPFAPAFKDGYDENNCGDEFGNYIEEAFTERSLFKTLIIMDGVKTVGDWAFPSPISLSNLFISDSVESIGDGSFSDCSSLIELTIGNNVETIGEYAFSGCILLTELTIPNSVETIGDSAFIVCNSLRELTIPNSVITIGDSAFAACNSLTELTIGSNVKTIGAMAFSDCKSLIELTIGNNVETIGARAFSGCNFLRELTIPNSVETIGRQAFGFCYALTYLTIGSNVKTIGEYAFTECYSLRELTIPNSVETIGDYAFNDAPSNMIVYGHSGTYAETWANSNSYTFIALEE